MRLGGIYSKCKKYHNYIKEQGNEIVFLYEQIQSSLSVEKEEKKLLWIDKMNEVYKKSEEILGDIAFLNCSFTEINKRRFDGQFDSYIDEITKLSEKVWCIVQLCESLEMSENKLGIDIKIPATDDITDFRKYIDDLEFIFTKCPFFQDDKESLKLNSVDRGSIWLVIGVTGVSAMGSVILNNIAAFIDKCIILKSHWLTVKQQEQVIAKASISQHEKDEIFESIKKIYKVYVDNAIKDLEESTGKKLRDGDEKGRAEQSFDRLEKLMDKGLQIYASIDSPEEVKAVFEPIETHFLSEKDTLASIEKKLDE